MTPQDGGCVVDIAVVVLVVVLLVVVIRQYVLMPKEIPQWLVLYIYVCVGICISNGNI